jgi:hypothetical protein
MSATLTDHPHRADPAAGIGHVVLGRTPRGDAETQRAMFPLSAAQRDLLNALDGKRSLHQLVVTQPALQSARLARDAARLLAFGLVKQLRGELPRDVVVSSMNLTMRVPAEAFGHLQQANAEPGKAATPKAAVPPAQRHAHWPWFTLALAASMVLLVVLWSLK